MTEKICRICLITDVKMYDIKKYNLNKYYQNLLGDDKAPSNNFPICFQCAILLSKCYIFKQKCLKGQEIIEKLSQSGQITISSINKINREEFKLISPLSSSAQTNTNIYYYQYKVKQQITTIPHIEEEIKINNYLENEDDIDRNDVNSEDNIYRNDPEDLVNENNLEVNKYKDQKLILNKVRLPKRKFKDNKTVKVQNSSNERELKIIDSKLKTKLEIPKIDETKWNRVVLEKEEVFREFNRRGERNQNFAFTCDLCFQGFCSKDTLLRHMTIHSKERGRFKCEVCKKRFKWKTKLNCHMSAHTVRYHCLRCPKICLTLSQVNIHEKYHEGIDYLCKICGAKFVKMTTYYSHMRLKHRSDHVCSSCGASFVSDNGLSQHRTRTHGNVNQEVTEENASKDLNCDKCNIQFDNKMAFDTHITNSANHSQIIIDDKNNVKDNMTNRNVTAEQIKCNQCEEWFKSKEALTRHEKRVHKSNGEPKYEYICEICGAGVTKSCIWQHRNSHTKGLVFPCTVCGRKFNSPANRYRHMVTHTGEKPFDCKLCDKKFTQRCNLKLHFWSFHLKKPHPYVRNARRNKHTCT